MSCVLTEAPWCNSTLTTASCPFQHAYSIGVKPRQSVSSARGWRDAGVQPCCVGGRTSGMNIRPMIEAPLHNVHLSVLRSNGQERAPCCIAQDVHRHACTQRFATSLQCTVSV